MVHTSDKEATKAFILKVAKQKGWFSVTTRKQNDWLRALCDELCDKNKLVFLRTQRGYDLYKLKA